MLQYVCRYARPPCSAAWKCNRQKDVLANKQINILPMSIWFAFWVIDPNLDPNLENITNPPVVRKALRNGKVSRGNRGRSEDFAFSLGACKSSATAADGLCLHPSFIHSSIHPSITPPLSLSLHITRHSELSTASCKRRFVRILLTFVNMMHV